jgi:hypothetical protein
MESSVPTAVFVIKEEHPLVRKMKEVETNMKKNGGKPLMMPFNLASTQER